jgi:hypothetical protein
LYLNINTLIHCSIPRITVGHGVQISCNSTDSALLPSPASADENVGKARQRIAACEYAASLRLVTFLEAATNKHRGTPAAVLKKR